MAETINVTPEKLRSTAGAFNQAGTSIKKTTTEMMQIIQGISHSVWSGEACSSYIGKFKGLEGDVSKMCKMIEDQVTHLNAIAQEYQTAESQNKAASAALKNNVLV